MMCIICSSDWPAEGHEICTRCFQCVWPHKLTPPRLRAFGCQPQHEFMFALDGPANT